MDRHHPLTAHRIESRRHRDAKRLADAFSSFERPLPDLPGPFRPPRPVRIVLVDGLSIGIPVFLGAHGVLPSWIAGIMAGLLLLFVALRFAVVYRDLRMSRELGDRLLRAQTPRSRTPIAIWRARELNSMRGRRKLQKLVRRAARDNEAALGFNLDTARIARESLTLLHGLEERLGDEHSTVSAAGVLALKSLLRSGNWSLREYPERASALPSALRHVLSIL